MLHLKNSVSATKSAALGGEIDVPFEQAFSNLAHSYLKDKAPGLGDYEVGFQLLDKANDNTKAVGLFGFKVGQKWLYAPVFFLNGDLKGHELLYIKDQDLFVPMKENWLNYIMNRKPNVLGREVDKNMRNLGVTAPHLDALWKSPSKYSAAIRPWARDFVPVSCFLAESDVQDDTSLPKPLDLPAFLKKSDQRVLRTFVKTCETYPAFAATVDKVYGLDKLLTEVAESYEKSGNANCYSPPRKLKVQRPVSRQSMPDKPISMEELEKYNPITSKNAEVTIVTYKDINAPVSALMTDEDKEEVLGKGVIIRDKRSDEDTTVAYNVEPDLQLTNPTESGIYDVLMKPGQFEKCLVILSPYGGAAGYAQVAVLVRLDDGKEWLNVHPTRVWSRGQRVVGDEFDSWWNGLPDCDSLEVGGYDKQYMILGRGANGPTEKVNGTFPFYVRQELGLDGGETKCYGVGFEDYGSHLYSKPEYLQNDRRFHYATRVNDDATGPPTIVLSDKRGSHMRMSNGTLYVPPGCKLLSLEKNQDCGICSSSTPPGEKDDGKKPNRPMALGNIADIHMAIAGSTHKVKASYHDGRYQMDGQMRDKVAMLVHLVRDHGLREKTAQLLMDDVAKYKRGEYRFKYAMPYPLQQSAPSAPSMPEPTMGADPMVGGKVPTQDYFEAAVPVPGMSAENTDPSVYNPTTVPDPHAMQSAMTAAQTGQKEVFDTSVIGSLLKSVRDDSLVDRHLKDLMTGCDRVGRILFSLYWRRDKFEERYGKQDVIALEDALRNTFEGIGDLILMLKEREINDYDKLLENDLSDTTGTASAQEDS